MIGGRGEVWEEGWNIISDGGVRKRYSLKSRGRQVEIDDIRRRQGSRGVNINLCA